MPFQKGNKLWDNPKSKKNWIRKNEHKSKNTEFKKDNVPWNEGTGKEHRALSRQAWKAVKNKPKICEKCQGIDRLSVHHKDKNRENNNPKNLQILCIHCHSQLHGKEGNGGQFQKGNVPWNKGVVK